LVGTQSDICDEPYRIEPDIGTLLDIGTQTRRGEEMDKDMDINTDTDRYRLGCGHT
jgi:hypothetical protein